MRVILLLSLLATYGCAVPQHAREIEFSSNPARDIELRRLWSRGEASRLELRNTSSRSVRYLHWAGQGPEPIAYCAREDGSQWLCSERVFIEGDEKTGFTEWSHETVLPPRAKVKFRIRADADRPVGIKVFPDGSSDESLVWATN
jgi:hypothetical protein